AEDSDLDPVRSDPRFAKIVANSKSEAATRRVNEATERLAELQASPDADGDDWFDTGLSLLRLRHLDESIGAFQHAIAANEKRGTSYYNIACAYSLKGDSARAFEALNQAIENGFGNEEKFENDPDLRALQNTPQLRALAQRADELQMRGCCGDDEDEASSWGEAARYERSITQKYPDSGRAWFNLGYTALQARDFPTALDSFQRAIDRDYKRGTSSYNMACAYALRGDKDSAFAWLNKARETGFDLADYLDDDEDLDSLHGDPRYDALVRESGESHRPLKLHGVRKLEKIARKVVDSL
ncbi:MAG TPA: tetratricopeptide repeat protein, partial [Thermoanaerobaculia bacterium]|nr:tetratricopeptide repeat protein [Thermoanaerobaculia bacterium]